MHTKPAKPFEGVLAEPIKRDPPWLTLAAPSPPDKAQDLANGVRVEFERHAKLQALAIHYEIDTTSAPAWVFLLASRLATELGIPGFQELWSGPMVDELKEISSMREKYPAMLGLSTADKSGKIVGRPPGGATGMSPVSLYLAAELLKADKSVESYLDAAAYILMRQDEKFRNRLKNVTNAAHRKTLIEAKRKALKLKGGAGKRVANKISLGRLRAKKIGGSQKP